MATVNELVIKIMLDGKEATARVQNFGEIVRESVDAGAARTNALGATFNRVGEAAQKAFFIFQGFKMLTRPLGEMVSLANQQEQADQRLIGTLQNLNIHTKENFELLKQQASAIQNLTVVGDEQSQMLQGLALNFGITFDRVNESVRGAIGLSTMFRDAGLSQETAMKGIALAYQGNFEQLQRYIPSLRNAADETEKMAILQEAMANGFKLAEQEAKTGAGRMQQFNNLLGDAKESLGELIKTVLLPLLEVGSKVLIWFNSLNEGTVQFIAVVGLLTAAGWKLIPMFMAWNTSIQVLGISIKTALGWIGLIIAAATLIYTAWNTNLFGIRSALGTAWEYIKTWFGIVLDAAGIWAANMGEIFRWTAESWKAIFNFDWVMLSVSLEQLKNAYAKTFVEIAQHAIERHRHLRERLKEQDEERAREQAAHGKVLGDQINELFDDAEDAQQEHSDTIVETDKKEKLRLALQAQQLRDLRIQNMEDEFDRRRAEVEAWFEDERANFEDNADIIVELEKQKAQRIAEIEMQRKAHSIQVANEILNEEIEKNRWFFETLEGAYDEFFNTVTDLEMTGAERRQAIWEATKQSFVASLADQLKQFIANKARESLIHGTTEATKTAATKTQTATRSGVTIAAIAKEIWHVMRSIGVWIGQIAVKLFAWFASLGPIGLLVGVATVGATIAMVKGFINQVMNFAEGGIALEEIFARIGEKGDKEAVIPLNERGAQFMANLLPKIVVPAPTAPVELGGVNARLDALEKAISGLKLSANFDADQLAIVVENGNKLIGDITF